MKKILYIALLLIGFTGFSQERYSVKLASFNSKVSDFGAAYTPKGDLIFASERDSGTVVNRRHRIDGKLRPYLQLFTISKENPSEVTKLSSVVNKKYHESTVALTNDGKIMYFTRNNYFNRQFKKDSHDINLLKLFKATKLEDGSWGEIEELPFNDDEYSVAHPALNADNSRLYFASDMPGTIGKSDIWYVKIHKDGSYSDPINMRSVINTAGADTFPFLTKNDDLYFSSDTHSGKGGLDVFVAKKENNYSKVYNLGAPINTIYDDFSFIFSEQDKTGYLSSNRENGIGDDDIYELKELSPLTINCKGVLSGTTKDSKGAIVANANVVLIDNAGKEMKTLQSDSNGVFSFNIDCKNQSFSVTGSKPTYEDDSKKVTATVSEKNPTANLVLKIIDTGAAVGVDLAKKLNLKPIYFDLNKANIRPDAALELQKVISYMQQYPKVIIQVRAHTDSRGRDSYNMKLSDRRAKSTAKFIIEVGGVLSGRISGKGFGETKLQNKCTNNVKCSKREHQSNRRSEFIVTEK